MKQLNMLLTYLVLNYFIYNFYKSTYYHLLFNSSKKIMTVHSTGKKPNQTLLAGSFFNVLNAGVGSFM